MKRLDHLILSTGCILMCWPLAMVFISAGRTGGLNARGGTPSLSGFGDNFASLSRLVGPGQVGPTLESMILTSALTGLGVAVLTTTVSFLAAYSMTYLARRGTRLWFWLTLLTLYFPIEARMLPTFEVSASLGLINSLPGLVLPILPLALATFIFCQHMRTLPFELAEAARLDGAGPLVFLRDFLVPLSLVPVGAVLLITFILGWNQYLWPLMISVDNTLFPLTRGLNLVGTGSGASMVLALASVLPALLLVIGFVRLMSQVTAIRM